MATHTRTAPRKRVLASVLTGALIATVAALGAAAPAQAAEAEVDGAAFSWGLRDSWRNYIGGPIANGTVTATTPTTVTPGPYNATTNADGLKVHWAQGTGEVDDTTYAGAVSFPGEVRYYGHGGDLDINLSNPTISITGGTVTLLFDTTSKAYGSGFPAVDQSQFAWATFALPTPTISGDTATFTTGQGTFTSEAVVALGNFYASNPYTDPITFSLPLSEAETPVAGEPTLSVSKTSGLNPAGETITITGENYDTSAQATYGAPGPAGFYAQVGWLDAAWQPSEGAGSTARSNAYSVWVQATNETAPYLKWTDNGDGTADFTWTVTIDKATLDAKSRDGATLAVFTVGAGGVVQAVNEKSVALSFTSAPAGAEDVVVEVPAWVEQPTGSFGWSFASETPANLGVAVQEGANFVAEGSLTEIIVTDDRAGGTGPYTWSISGSVDDFKDGSKSFTGGYFGWEPRIVSGGASVAAGAAVTSSLLGGGTGLASSSELASSTAAASARLGADLKLVIPGTTPAGDYTAKLTITSVS